MQEFITRYPPTQQTLNSYNKCIYIHYDSIPLSMSVHFLHPLNNVPEFNSFHEASFNDAIEFIKTHQLKIKFKDVSRKTQLIGLWVVFSKFKTFLMYIPIRPFDIVPQPGLEAPPTLFDATTSIKNEQSKVKFHGYIEKVAFILREYVLFDYTHYSDQYVDIETGLKRFIVVPGYQYSLDLLDHRLELNNPVIYLDGKIIVWTEFIAKQLIKYVISLSKSNHDGVMAYSYKTFFNDYRSDADFVKKQESLIFNDIEHVKYFIQTKNNNFTHIVQHYSLPKQTQAYLYAPDTVSNYHYDDSDSNKTLGICIVQYTLSDSYEDAIFICDSWNKDFINDGYYPSKKSKVRISKIHIYTEFIHQWRQLSITKGKNHAFLLEYTPKKYAALLPIRT